MKQIKAFIQPFKLEDVVQSLREIKGLPGLVVTEVGGFGRGGQTRGGTLMTKLELQIVVPDEMAAAVIDAIQESAHTGNKGDGKIFVTNVETAVRIRTNERGDSAI